MSNKLLITGASGMLGHSLKKVYPSAHFVTSRDCNLVDKSKISELFSDLKPTHVIHLAAKVGGILSNKTFMAEFYHENIMMNTNILEESRKQSVKKLVSVLSTCIYPDSCSYPLKEESIHDGPPHNSNYGYAYAKRMLDIQSRAYRDQYGCNFVTVVPNNLYGENDNFHLTDSHVIPAIIRKVFIAKQTGEPVILWGDGSPLREFTYSADIARAIKVVIEKYNDPLPINIGNTKEISIKEVFQKIAENLDYNGVIIWDDSMPSGQYRKPSDNTRFLKISNNFQYTDFEKGIKSVCQWFLDNQPDVRGM